jgi:2-polyprenyl-6-methoxyphenol hydroxylase-like FAD-dependent oxidoreductase
VSPRPQKKYDAIVVGARCAGSTLANALARSGWDVLLTDRAEFPSDTVSTNGIWPNGVARLDELGVLGRLLAKHEVPMNATRIVGLGHESSGRFTPVNGFDRGMTPRRIVLDQAGVEAAAGAGAGVELGTRVVGLIGTGTEDDPVAGVRLEDGRSLGASWVFGCDGRASTVAQCLGLAKERPMRGEMSFAYAYWRNVPNDGFGGFEIEVDRVLTSAPVEDGLHMFIVSGAPEMVVGSSADRTRRYLELLRSFRALAPPGIWEKAERVTDVQIAPESLMRGFFRRPNGPGWALAGDASHFKHPGTAQGITDAIESSIHIADSLSRSGGDLAGYEAWREARAAEHYEWSFAWGSFPKPENEAIFRGWATEPDAAQDLRDTFTRTVEPSQLMTKDRLERWFGAAS